MNLPEFSKQNLTRCTSPAAFNHALDSWSAAEWTNAMAGEVGEAANLTKKLLRHRDGIAGNVKLEDRDAADLRRRAAREIADVVIYADLAVQALGFDLTTELRAAFNEKSDQLGCDIKV
jgi:NTP pyrophosphatase (non-canonical NTP hydrolase)